MSYTARTIRLVFFSGTGGTEMAASHLTSALRRRGVTVFEHELHVRQPFDDEQADLLVLMYPVYAGSAPAPVYAYLKRQAELNTPAAAVICVTGGGDATVNRGSRQRAIRLLEGRDCRVVYESMLVMPSNAITPTPYNIALRLIKILPEKTEIMAGELVSGVTRRIKPGYTGQGRIGVRRNRKKEERYASAKKWRLMSGASPVPFVLTPAPPAILRWKMGNLVSVINVPRV